MTAYGDYFLSLLDADTLLMNMLPGGAWLYQDAGRAGLNRIELMQAFIKTSGLLQPTAIVYEAQTVPDNVAVSPVTGLQSTITPIACWVYDEGDNGFGAVEAAVNRMKTLTNFARIPNGFQYIWGTIIRNKREPLLSDASFNQCNLRAYGYWTS